MDGRSETLRRILVIDDSVEFLRLVRSQLRREGVALVEATDGPSGIELAREVQPDLILLDVYMPGPDGFETIRALKEDLRTRSIPVIFLSALPTTELKARGLDLGAIDFISKPFDPVELRARVRSGLRTKYLQDVLELRAHLDGLTGLGNRLALEDRLSQEWKTCLREGTSLAVILADLDRFKEINDQHGHPAGDLILQATAQAFKDVVRAGDFVARYGGEEFIALAPDCDLDGATTIAERFRSFVADMPVPFQEGILHITTSVGVSSLPSEAMTRIAPRELLRRADEALYQAKESGRNSVRFWHDRSKIFASGV